MLASAPTFLCFLLNMIIKKQADHIRPYGYRNNLLVVFHRKVFCRGGNLPPALRYRLTDRRCDTALATKQSPGLFLPNADAFGASCLLHCVQFTREQAPALRLFMALWQQKRRRGG